MEKFKIFLKDKVDILMKDIKESTKEQFIVSLIINICFISFLIICLEQSVVPTILGYTFGILLSRLFIIPYLKGKLL